MKTMNICLRARIVVPVDEQDTRVMERANKPIQLVIDTFLCLKL